jgi:hypothetical protein
MCPRHAEATHKHMPKGSRQRVVPFSFAWSGTDTSERCLDCMYRDALLAADSQIEALRTRLARSEEEVARIAEARARAEADLVRVREGVDPDPSLHHDRSYKQTRMGFYALVLCSLILFCVVIELVLSRWMPDPMLSLSGLRNFAWSVQHGGGIEAIAATGFIAVLLSPWLLSPLLALRGLSLQRRWGWMLGVVACCLFLPTPLLPFSTYGLTVLFSKRVRSVFFA